MADPLKSVQWFPRVDAPKPKGGLASALAKLAVGAGVGVLLFVFHHETAAIVVWSLATVLGVVTASWSKAGDAVDAAGRWVGAAISAVLLTIVYLAVVTPMRVFRRLLGADDLHLRDGHRQTFWLPCDDEARKVRWVGSMFATEAPASGGHPVRTALVVLIALTLLSEGILRTQGFGHTVTYVADPVVGYYPEPSVNLVRYGGVVRTNKFGMRSREIAADKPAGAFRVLMLGDSTLYGGSYVDQDDLYSSRLDAQLNRRGLPGTVEVLAMGANGWGPFHERGYVAKFGTFGADLAIVNLPIDDVNRPLYGLMSVPFFSVQKPPRLALEEVLNHFMWRYRSAHAGLDESYEKQQSQIGIREYGRLVDDLQQHGAEVMVAVLPGRSAGFGGPESPRETAWREQLEQVVRERDGVRTYFAKGLFAEIGAPDEMYHDSVHLKTLGHHIYADFLEGRIVADSVRFREWAGASR